MVDLDPAAKDSDIDLDDLDRPVPSEFKTDKTVLALSPSISICLASLPLGDVASMESLELPALRDRGIAEVLRGLSRGSPQGETSPVTDLPIVRHGLSSTQFHPGAVARGVSPNLLLHSFGALLQNGVRRRNDQQLSQELKQENLHMFISHSWTVGRWRKFIVMALYFNGQQAAIISLLVQVASFIAVVTGVLPVVATDTTDIGISPWCFLFGTLAFWLSVLLYHELMLLCGWNTKMAFFDTACIDQSDEEKKREGIEAITAYLFRSERLFVVLSEVYLQRIWTVFEMAAFLAVNHSQYNDSQDVRRMDTVNRVHRVDSRVIVQPAALALLIPACFIFQMARPVGDYARCTVVKAQMADGTQDVPALTLAGVLIFLALFLVAYLVMIIKAWGLMRAQLAHQVDTFSFASAKCHHEPDRQEISIAVKYLAERIGLVGSEDTLRQAHQALESHARQMVWPAMADALSPAGIPPCDAWLIAVPVIAVALDDFAMAIIFFPSLHVVLTSLLAHAAVALNFPIVIALVSISSCRPKRSCAYECFATLLCVAATFCFVSTRGVMNAWLLDLAQGRGIPRLDAILSVILVIQVLVLWCCYGSGIWHLRRCCCRWKYI